MIIQAISDNRIASSIIAAGILAFAGILWASYNSISSHSFSISALVDAIEKTNIAVEKLADQTTARFSLVDTEITNIKVEAATQAAMQVQINSLKERIDALQREIDISRSPSR